MLSHFLYPGHCMGISGTLHGEASMLGHLAGHMGRRPSCKVVISITDCLLYVLVGVLPYCSSPWRWRPSFELSSNEAWRHEQSGL